MSLYRNIQAKRKRIAAGSGEEMRKVGAKGAPKAKNFRQFNYLTNYNKNRYNHSNVKKT